MCGLGNTNDNDDALNRSKLEEVYTINLRENVPVLDTLIWLETEVTEQATGAKERKFNAEVTRLTISYDTEKREIDYTLRPSRSFADAVLHSYVMIAKRDPTELDLESLYEINDRLIIADERLGYHDFSYDDKDISLGQPPITFICFLAILAKVAMRSRFLQYFHLCPNIIFVIVIF